MQHDEPDELDADELDAINSEVAAITDEHVEEKLQGTLEKAGYAYGGIVLRPETLAALPPGEVLSPRHDRTVHGVSGRRRVLPPPQKPEAPDA